MNEKNKFASSKLSVFSCTDISVFPAFPLPLTSSHPPVLSSSLPLLPPQVSFEPKDEDTTSSIPKGFTLGTNFFVDNGKEFGARGGGQQYGWSCDMTDNMENGFEPKTANTVDTTNADMSKKCPGGPTLGSDYRVKVRFSFKVPNGAYDVYTHQGAGSAKRSIAGGNRGCTVENVRLGSLPSYTKDAVAISIHASSGGSNIFGPQVVVVRDGQIDFSAPIGMSACGSISWIRFKRIGDAGPGTVKAPPVVPSAWLTGATKSWWHRKLREAGAPVGIVVLTPPSGASSRRPSEKWADIRKRTNGNRGSAFSARGSLLQFGGKQWSCRSHWLFAGDDCTERGFEMSQFDPDAPGGDNVGYTVTVSDQPCSGTGGCPSTAKTTVCELIMSQPFEPAYCISGTDKDNLCPVHHDCKGAKGDYVRIELRGERRIVDVDVDVNRASVEASTTAYGDNTMVCWAVVPRPEASLPVPLAEFYTTMDPEDPIFYSTCYVKEIEWLWESTGEAQKATPRPWKINGECINCDDWRQKTSTSKYVEAS